MQLVRLEMFGFKSFSDPTVLHFKDGVTGIVGPNGCGKSNVVDAIFWVMGEQSAKHLRGASMEDVIFNGSEKRERSQFAQVTLVVTKEGVILPADYDKFSEIQITRKLYRSGESEYSLNQIPCRLRDIHDLFMGTGVGTKAYSIIEQGAISKMVNAKPEDRRLMIEEAAGITKYKKRRLECARKLEGTQQNLLRINDIVHEKGRRLSSLERQAKRAEKFRGVRNRAKSIDLALSSTRAGVLTTSREEARIRVDSLTSSHAGAAAVMETASVELQQQRLELTQLETKIQDGHNKLVQLTSQEGRAERELAVTVQNMEGLSRDKERLSGEAERLEERLLDLTTEREALDETAEALRSRFEQAETSAQEKMNGVEQLKNQLSSFEATERHETQERIKRIERLAFNQTLVEQQRSQLSELEQKLLLLNNHRDELKKNHEQLALELDSKKQQLTAIVDEQTEFEEKERELVQSLAQRQSDLKKTQTQLNDLERTQMQLQAEYDSLQALQESLEGFEEGIRSLAQNRSEDTWLLSQVLEVPDEFVPSVEILLGSQLQSLVVPNLQEAQKLGQQLRQNGKGRGTFLPVSCRMSAQGDMIVEEHPLASDAGFDGFLRSSISVKEGFEGVADFLFHRVIVARTLSDAVRWWESDPQFPFTIVTREGDVLAPSGQLMSGSPSLSSAGAWISRKNRIEALKKKLEETGAKRALLEPGLEKIAEDIAALTEARQGMETTLRTHRDRHNDVQRDLSVIESRLQQTAQELKRWDRELTDLETARSRFTAATENALHENEIIVEKQALESSVFENLHRETAQLKAQLSEAETALSEERIQLAQSKEKWLSAQERLQEKQGEEDELRSELEWTQSQQATVFTQLEDCVTKKADLEVAVVSSGNERGETEQALIELRNSLSVQQQRLQTLESQVDGTRKEADSFRQGLMEATLAFERTDAELRLLREHLMERYHLETEQLNPETAWAELREQQPDLAEASPETLQQELIELRGRLAEMGDVNPAAADEYDEVKKEHDFLIQQKTDLETALTQLEQTIQEMDGESEKLFVTMFHSINEKFQQTFPILFGGGTACLELTDPNNLLESGVDIIAQPPGKKLQSIGLLSGGEKALTAVSLIFAIFTVKPSPFCILDEVDAPLDDANVGRFNNMIRKMSPVSQFILITHNKRTMEMADILYGVTMQEAGVSRMVSTRLS